MSHLKHYQSKNGFTKLSSTGDGGLRMIEFGVISLKKGEIHSSETGGTETVLITLGGDSAVSGDGFNFEIKGARKDVFSGKPHAVYIPAGNKYTVKALTDTELAWTCAPSALRTEPYMIKPEQVKEAHLGRENYQRDAYLTLTDAFPSAHLFIGEAYVPSGNHASYPPHRHERDNPPVEIDMEELYFFRFNPCGGYGIQRIYTDDRSIDFTGVVAENDATLIPRGYHPVVNAPGYTMWYLWIMAGPVNRGFISVMDPAHKWISGK